jgi:hypothetical protein
MHTLAWQCTLHASTLGFHLARSLSCSAPYPRCCLLPRARSACRLWMGQRFSVCTSGHPGWEHTFILATVTSVVSGAHGVSGRAPRFPHQSGRRPELGYDEGPARKRGLYVVWAVFTCLDRK